MTMMTVNWHEMEGFRKSSAHQPQQTNRACCRLQRRLDDEAHGQLINRVGWKTGWLDWSFGSFYFFLVIWFRYVSHNHAPVKNSLQVSATRKASVSLEEKCGYLGRTTAAHWNQWTEPLDWRWNTIRNCSFTRHFKTVSNSTVPIHVLGVQRFKPTSGYFPKRPCVDSVSTLIKSVDLVQVGRALYSHEGEPWHPNASKLCAFNSTNFDVSSR